MSTTYQPLSEVRRAFKIDWYRCPIEGERLRQLAQRSDAKGWFQALGHLLLIAATGVLTHLLFVNQIWAGFALALWVHGIIYSFVPGLVTHELSHGTVFRTRALNGFFLRLYSLIGWINFHHYKRSHTYHHMYTLHPEGDREVVLPANPSLRAVRLFWMFTFDLPVFLKAVSGHLKLALFGKFGGFYRTEWSEAIFPADDPHGRRQAIVWSRLVLLFHLAVIALSIALRLWMLPVIVSLGSFIGGWWKYFVGYTMHTGLRDNVPDWRKCARTIKLDPFSRFIYWNMNYHIEHHMYAAIPCYNLPKLSKEIAWDMPEPRTMLQAWKEMRDTYQRQKADPAYQFDTPVPNEGAKPQAGDPVGSSLGDLEP